MANKQLFQLFSDEEELPGIVSATVLDVANGRVRVKDPVFTFDVEKYDREILAGASLSQQLPLIGKVEANISFGVELAGGATSSEPPWAHILRACGFRQFDINSASWTGTFGGSAAGAAKHLYTGQIIQTAAAAKTAMVVHDTYEGQTKIHLLPIIDVPASTDVWWPATSDLTVGPTVTTGANSAIVSGPAWIPESVPRISLDTTGAATGTVSVGDILKGGTSAAILQAITAVTSAGTYEFRIFDGTPVASETFTNITTGATGTFAVSATPAFVQTRIPTLTIALIEDGRIKIAKGCRGSVNFSAERGKPMFMNFTFKGVVSSISTGGQITGVPHVSKVPKVWTGIGFLFQSYVSGEAGYFNHLTAHTPRIVSANFDMGNTPVLQEDATQTNGVNPFATSNNRRTTSGAMKIDLRPEGAWPLITKLSNGQPFAIKHRIPGGDSNTFLISAPGCLSSGVSPSDTNNIAQDDVAYTMTALKPDGTEGEERELVISFGYLQTTMNW